MLKDYYALAKPGLVYGNLITVIAGFLVGAAAIMAPVATSPFFAVIFGMAFIMGSGCVFNNVIDRDIDGKMDRTKHRATVTGRISKRNALVYGLCLLAAGFVLLAAWTNFLAVAAAAVGFFAYVVLYSLWAKRRTAWGTEVGSIAGAMPPVVGYCAASGRFDLGAALLFAILVLWQMPHFYAIAIYRLDDYTAAHVPVLPAHKGIRATKIVMLFFIIAFALVAPLLAVFGYAGVAYFSIASGLGFAWLLLCIRGFWLKDARAWARKMFFLSLIVMVVLFITLGIGAVWR